MGAANVKAYQGIVLQQLDIKSEEGAVIGSAFLKLLPNLPA